MYSWEDFSKSMNFSELKKNVPNPSPKFRTGLSFFFGRVKTYFLYSLFIILLFRFDQNPLFADTVVLRNGVEYKNVKTNLGKTSLKIRTESGSTFNVPITAIKSIKSIPVQWEEKPGENGPVEEVEAVSEEEDQPENPTTSNESLNTQNDPTFKSRTEAAKLSILESLPSLIPGWSNLYFLGYPSLGALFSLTELYLVHLISLYSKHSSGYYEDPTHLAAAYVNLDPNVSSQNPKFASLVFAYENSFLVKDPISGGYTTHDKVQEGKERSITGLITVLLLDFSITQMLSMNAKFNPQKNIGAEKGSFDIRVGGRMRPEAGEMESKLSFVFYF
ncbi:hypothetical protein CH367_13295 [Leptospira barantonii]|uniref:DUF5683 domain-containing protein n=2 Tax=Leptospira barantonii TaxID=2023184 RepID=A0ABX4NK48_9LEPT|nr:hypothetical protein CH367_13295 [Leptospira barantonii]